MALESADLIQFNPPSLRVRYTTLADFKSGRTLLETMFGNIPVELQRRQAQALIEDTKEIRGRLDFPPKWKQVIVNTARLKDFTGTPEQVIANLNFGRVMVMDGEGTLDQDIMKVARDVLNMLIMASPVRPATMRAQHPRGFYKRNHEIWLATGGGRPARAAITSKPKDDTTTVTIVNRVDYSSVIEAPKRQRIYQKVFRRAVKKYSDEWDLQLEFINPRSGFGGNIYSNAWGLRNQPTYNIPALSIAPLNTLRFPGKFIFVKRRVRGSKRNLRRR